MGTGTYVAAAIGGTLLVLGITIGGCWGCPQYKVYEQRMSGEARLREAESSRRITVLEAEAKKDSAKKLAEAEIERAKGVAEANEIIGKSLRDNEAYLRYLWIQGLQDGSSEVIYIPTEANLPLLEARNKRAREETKKEE
jgi:regulator of protease activity HflC (stomatin/prohibitin superfamily)